MQIARALARGLATAAIAVTAPLNASSGDIPEVCDTRQAISILEITPHGDRYTGMTREIHCAWPPAWAFYVERDERIDLDGLGSSDRRWKKEKTTVVPAPAAWGLFSSAIGVILAYSGWRVGARGWMSGPEPRERPLPPTDIRANRRKWLRRAYRG